MKKMKIQNSNDIDTSNDDGVNDNAKVFNTEHQTTMPTSTLNTFLFTNDTSTSISATKHLTGAISTSSATTSHLINTKRPLPRWASFTPCKDTYTTTSSSTLHSNPSSNFQSQNELYQRPRQRQKSINEPILSKSEIIYEENYLREDAYRTCKDIIHQALLQSFREAADGLSSTESNNDNHHPRHDNDEDKDSIVSGMNDNDSDDDDCDYTLKMMNGNLGLAEAMIDFIGRFNPNLSSSSVSVSSSPSPLFRNEIDHWDGTQTSLNYEDEDSAVDFDDYNTKNEKNVVNDDNNGQMNKRNIEQISNSNDNQNSNESNSQTNVNSNKKVKTNINTETNQKSVAKINVKINTKVKVNNNDNIPFPSAILNTKYCSTTLPLVIIKCSPSPSDRHLCLNYLQRALLLSSIKTLDAASTSDSCADADDVTDACADVDADADADSDSGIGIDKERIRVKRDNNNTKSETLFGKNKRKIDYRYHYHHHQQRLQQQLQQRLRDRKQSEQLQKHLQQTKQRQQNQYSSQQPYQNYQNRGPAVCIINSFSNGDDGLLREILLQVCVLKKC